MQVQGNVFISYIVTFQGLLYCQTCSLILAQATVSYFRDALGIESTPSHSNRPGNEQNSSGDGQVPVSSPMDEGRQMLLKALQDCVGLPAPTAKGSIVVLGTHRYMTATLM
jgi:hypothetical protein